MVIALASTAVATVVSLPAGIAQAPHTTPGWKVIGSVVALGVPGTALAYLLFFGIITGAGAAYASLVTYLIPPIALAYGAIFLGERFGAAALGGARARPRPASRWDAPSAFARFAGSPRRCSRTSLLSDDSARVAR